MRRLEPRELRRHGGTGRARLARLADFVARQSPRRLTFARWYGLDSGCALGLAAAEDPWFRAQGLRLEPDPDSRTLRPVYDGMTDWAAVARFLELDVASARELLGPEGYSGRQRPDPRAVADKLRARLGADVTEAAG